MDINEYEIGPLSNYFINHDYVPASQEWTAMQWLSTLKHDMFDLIKDAADTFFNDKTENNEISQESLDYVLLCFLVAERETNIPITKMDETLKEDSVLGLGLFLIFESLRRKGLVSVGGSGKISELSENTTIVANTETGHVVGGAVKTLMEIGKQMEKSS